MSSFVILGVAGLFSRLFLFLKQILLADNVDPYQTPHHVASDLGLHCMHISLIRVSRYEWAKHHIVEEKDRRTEHKAIEGIDIYDKQQPASERSAGQ